MHYFAAALAALTALPLAAPIPARMDAVAARPAALQRAIQLSYDRMNAAHGRKDAAGVMRFYSYPLPVITDVGVRKRETREAAQRGLETAFRSARSVHVKTFVQKLAPRGPEADALVKTYLRFDGCDAAGTGERGTLYIHTLGVETWAKDAGGWRIRRRVELARGQKFLPE